jgi:hypothetical protein
MLEQRTDRRAHTGPEDGGINATEHAANALGPIDGPEGVKTRLVLVLGADGEEGRVGLHASLDEVEGVAERG